MDISKQIEEVFNNKGGLYKEEVSAAYDKYVKTISVDYMAVSLECCVFLMVLCDVIKPKTMLDLGSGISSYIFRHFKNKYSEDSCVWSIDADNEWLKKSKTFVEEYGLNIDNFKSWDDIKDDTTKFDLVFFDIDYTKNRINYVSPVLNSFVDSDSFIVFDDMHKGILVRAINNGLSVYDYKNVDIKKYTFDKYKRFDSLYYDISEKSE